MSIQNTQEEILAFIGEFTEEKGYPPTRRDIMNGCQISSTSVVQRYLGWMEEAGDIILDPGLSRGIRIQKCLYQTKCLQDLMDRKVLRVQGKYTCAFIIAGTVKHCPKRKHYVGEAMESIGEEGSQDVRDGESPSGGP